MEAKEIPANSTKMIYYFVWLAVCAIVAFLLVFPNTKLHYGFFMKLLGMIGGFLGGFVGFVVGDLIRRLAIPDMIFTSGGFFGLLRARLFWMCGPQLIGIVIGAALAVSLILKVN
ncbi:MAG: hypothetical protein V3573_01930 [Desulfovibrionaceae bacterium]